MYVCMYVGISFFLSLSIYIYIHTYIHTHTYISLRVSFAPSAEEPLGLRARGARRGRRGAGCARRLGRRGQDYYYYYYYYY